LVGLGKPCCLINPIFQWSCHDAPPAEGTCMSQMQFAKAAPTTSDRSRVAATRATQPTGRREAGTSCQAGRAVCNRRHQSMLPVGSCARCVAKRLCATLRKPPRGARGSHADECGRLAASFALQLLRELFDFFGFLVHADRQHLGGRCFLYLVPQVACELIQAFHAIAEFFFVLL